MPLLLRPPLALARLAFWLGTAAILFAVPSWAADGGNGSRNFSVPSSVPNYFSNEAGPIIGGAAESRRGELYTSQAPAQRTAPVATAPVAAAPAVAVAPVAAAPVPRARTQIAMAVPRGHAVQHALPHARHVAPTHQAALHGRAPARGSSHAPVAHVSARTAHAPARTTTKVSTAHRHARG
jgi:hypothetical protein